MVPRDKWNLTGWTGEDCLSQTTAALDASSRRMFEAENAKKHSDVTDDDMRRQLAEHRMLLARLKPA